MRLQTFRDVEIAFGRLERDVAEKSSTSNTVEKVVERVTTETEIDSYLAAGIVSHKLKHYFSSEAKVKNLVIEATVLPLTTNVVDLGSAAKRWKNVYTNDWSLTTHFIPVVSNASDIGSVSYKVANGHITNLYTYTSLYLQNRTASLPVKTDASKILVTAAINLASSTEVTGTLPVGKGGTGKTTHTTNAVLLGNGTSALSSVTGLSTYAANNLVTGITYTTDVINYKDHAGTNQTKTFLTSVTISSSLNLGFTKGVLTSGT